MTIVVTQTSARYQPLAQIERGGMAEVILAEMQIGTGITSLAVLKRLAPELADDPDFVSMFLREARLSARMNHPNVVRTYEIVEGAGATCIAMEYLDGQPLARVLNRLMGAETLSLAARLRVLVDVLAALHYAHELRDHDGALHGIVHRDVNPQNVFVTYDGTVKLLDFGVAKSVTDVYQTRPGELRGKLGYLAPEQALGEVVDRRADIFSVGVMLWEMASGRRMWQSMTEPSIMRQLTAGRIPPLPRDAAVPPGLADACSRALSRAPERRFATAAEFAAVLQRLLPRREEAKARHLGRIVTLAFGPERAARRTLIEEHLRRVRGSGGEDVEHLLSGNTAVTTAPWSLPELRPDRVTPGGMWSVDERALADAVEIDPSDILVEETAPGPAMPAQEDVPTEPVLRQAAGASGSLPRFRRTVWMATGFAVASAVVGVAFAGRAAGSRTANAARPSAVVSTAASGGLGSSGATVVPIKGAAARAAVDLPAAAAEVANCRAPEPRTVVAPPAEVPACQPAPPPVVRRRRSSGRVGPVSDAARGSSAPEGASRDERGSVARRAWSDDETLEPTIDLTGVGVVAAPAPVEVRQQSSGAPRAATTAQEPTPVRRSASRVPDFVDPFAPARRSAVRAIDVSDPFSP